MNRLAAGASRLALLAYALTMLAISFLHDPLALAALLGLALIASGRQRWRCLRRSLLAVLLFNLGVSLTYALVGWWQGKPVLAALLLINLRVLLSVYLGFWLVGRINLLAALARWPTLCLLATLALGQIRVYSRLLQDFRLAFVSRNLQPPRLADNARLAAAEGGTLMDKSLAAASESALAMRSRGAFDV